MKEREPLVASDNYGKDEGSAKVSSSYNISSISYIAVLNGYFSVYTVTGNRYDCVFLFTESSAKS